MKVNKVENKLKEIMEEMNFFPVMLKNTRGVIMYKHSYDYDVIQKTVEFNEMIQKNFTVKNVTYSRVYNGERNVRINIVPLSNTNN